MTVASDFKVQRRWKFIFFSTSHCFSFVTSSFCIEIFPIGALTKEAKQTPHASMYLSCSIDVSRRLHIEDELEEFVGRGELKRRSINFEIEDYVIRMKINYFWNSWVELSEARNKCHVDLERNKSKWLSIDFLFWMKTGRHGF